MSRIADRIVDHLGGSTTLKIAADGNVDLMAELSARGIDATVVAPEAAEVVVDDGRLQRMGIGEARLFSYGTLQLPAVQQDTFGRLLVGAEDRLPAHRTDWVTIADPEVIATSGTDRHPLVRPGGPDDVVEGMVLTITAEELAGADTYEVDDYRRIAVRLTSGTEAWVYLAR